MGGCSIYSTNEATVWVFYTNQRCVAGRNQSASLYLSSLFFYIFSHGDPGAIETPLPAIHSPPPTPSLSLCPRTHTAAQQVSGHTTPSRHFLDTFIFFHDLYKSSRRHVLLICHKNLPTLHRLLVKNDDNQESRAIEKTVAIAVHNPALHRETMRY